MIITLIQRDSTFESPSKPLLQLPEQPDQRLTSPRSSMKLFPKIIKKAMVAMITVKDRPILYKGAVHLVDADASWVPLKLINS